MAGAEVKEVPESHELEVDGHGHIEWDKYHGLGVSLEVIGPASLTSLIAVMRRPRCCSRVESDKGEEIWISPASSSEFDHFYSPRDPVSFEISKSRFIILIRIVLTNPTVNSNSIHQAIQPLVARRRCLLHDVKMEGVPAQRYVHVRLEPLTRGRIAADAYAIGKEVFEVLRALDGGGLNPTTTAELLRAGQAASLIGVEESDWLDVKERPYELKSATAKVAEAAKIELGQDVARFANAQLGGLLVVGMRARRRAEKEVVVRVVPANLDQLSVQQYRAVIDRRVFPPVENLSVEAIETSPGKGLLIILIPPQPEESKPFLVHGAIVGGQVEGAFISIVRRRGEASIPITGPSIHAMLVAGRALLGKTDARAEASKQD